MGRGGGMTSRQLKLAQQTTSKSSPEAAAAAEEEDEGWKHPAELIYSVGRYWTDKKVIFYLIANALAVSPRSETSPGVTYVTDGKKTVAVNEKYRIPIMFVSKWQFTKLKSLLTAEASEKSRRWPSEKYEILHIARVWKILTDEGPSGEDYGLQFRIEEIKQWRCWTLERVLTRFRLGCFSSEPSRVSRFWDQYGEAEYMKNPLTFNWRTFSSEGHEGVTLTDSEIEAGLDPKDLMKGLKEKEGGWFWETESNPVSGGTPAWDLREEARHSFSTKSTAGSTSKAHGSGSNASASKSRSQSKDSHKDTQSISAVSPAKLHSLQTEGVKSAPVSASSPISNAENESSQTPPRIRRSQNSISGVVSLSSVDANVVNASNTNSSISSAMPLSNQGLTNAAKLEVQTSSPATSNPYLSYVQQTKKQADSKPQNSPTSVSAVSQVPRPASGTPSLQRAPSGASTSAKSDATNATPSTAAPKSVPNDIPSSNNSARSVTPNTNSVVSQKSATGTASADTSPKIPGLNLNSTSSTVAIPSPTFAAPHKSTFTRPSTTAASKSTGASPIPTPSPTPTPTSAGGRPLPSSTTAKTNKEASKDSKSGNSTPAKTADNGPILILYPPGGYKAPQPPLPKSGSGASVPATKTSKETNKNKSSGGGGITVPAKTADDKRPPDSLTQMTPTLYAPGTAPRYFPPAASLPKSEAGTSISMPMRKTGLSPGARVQSPITPPPTFMMPVKIPVNGTGTGNGANGVSAPVVSGTAGSSPLVTVPPMSTISITPSALTPTVDPRPATPTSPIFVKPLLPAPQAGGTSTTLPSAPVSAPSGAGKKRSGSPLEQPGPSKKAATPSSISSRPGSTTKPSPAPVSSLNSPVRAHGWSAPPMPLDHLIGGRTADRKVVDKSGKDDGGKVNGGSTATLSIHPLAHLLGSRIGAGKDG